MENLGAESAWSQSRYIGDKTADGDYFYLMCWKNYEPGYLIELRFDGSWVQFWGSGFDKESCKCKFYADGSLRFPSSKGKNPLYIVKDKPDDQLFLNMEKSGERAFFMAEKVPKAVLDTIFQDHLYQPSGSFGGNGADC
ncbi:hypothetical protein H2201_003202 [Coniosporium apollinis]|uniref:Uncharacterized protein n=2 Tax=Coniosporium TaxID=2810619 RepID=A0ABQ9NYK1_9PEZI|nr:hypothetical protein H2199_008547 [Cladosporium sp. JES 115]KAJ9666798.1 hypothetical protein H2201_003202 [Coniosporium apollinis]